MISLCNGHSKAWTLSGMGRGLKPQGHCRFTRSQPASWPAARQLLAPQERSVPAPSRTRRGLSYRNDPGCQTTRAEVQRRIASIYATYEARQAAFDRVEHAEDGNVKGLVSLLSRARE